MNGTTILGNVQYEPFGPLASWTWGSGASMTRSYDLDGRPGAIDSAGNRLTSTTGALARTYSYDAAGNTTGYGNLSFSWGDAGRMASATASGTTTSYLYNGLGERVGKSSPGATRIYLHDEAGHLLGTYDGAGALIEEYLWLDDTPVALLRPAGAGTTVYYLHTDHLATPIRLTRASDNLVVWRWDADPFGSLAPAEDPDGDTLPLVFNLRFPGQYYDSETGLHYNYFRDYDPQVGRYLESDPIGLDGGLNTYGYVGQNPLRYSDVLGLDSFRCERNLRLGRVPIPRIGPLFHQFLCTDTPEGRVCRGLGPSSSEIFDTPGILEDDEFRADRCEMVADDNKCVDACLLSAFLRPIPNYSADLSRGENCQTYVGSALSECLAQCKVK